MIMPCFYLIYVGGGCVYTHIYIAHVCVNCLLMGGGKEYDLFHRFGNGFYPRSHCLVVAELDLGSGLRNSSPHPFCTPHCVPSNLEALSLGSESQQEVDNREN